MEAISIIQRGNLQSLERTLRKQWRLGQNIVLCWSHDERGLLVILVPHYFLGNYCARPEASKTGPDENELYIRALIAGERRKTRDELFAVAVRLGASPTFIKLDNPLDSHPQVLAGVEQIIRRYGLSYVDSRAVLLFDISDFSLQTPFEQASQLNSLSYSMNSVYNKLASLGIEINFARTTTGDGYYVWNRDRSADSDSVLFYFLVLVMLDNALAGRASRGNTVPIIRSAFHIGSHYELYQAEGVNPTVFSYIVGDVTIELARMLEKAHPRQILIGDFKGVACAKGNPQSAAVVNSNAFVNASSVLLQAVKGMKMMGNAIEEIRCWLTGDPAAGKAETSPQVLELLDKHGLSHRAYNLEIDVAFAGDDLRLGLTPDQLAAAD